MALFKYQCVYFGVETGGYTRQSRNPGSVGGFMPLNSSKNDPGTVHLEHSTPFSLQPALYPDLQIVQNGETYDFSFINVSGLTTGGATSFNASMPPTGTVSADINAVLQVLVVYVPEGGPGPGGDPGAVIDAFDETVGSLFNNYFVTVTPDEGSARYDTANIYGYVDTIDEGATITAEALFNPVAPASIMPPNVVFEEWKNLSGPSALPSGYNLSVEQGQTIYALAFYKTPFRKRIIKDIKDKDKDFDKHYIKDYKEAFTEHLKVVGDQFWVDPGEEVELGSEIRLIVQAIERIAIDVETLKGQSFIKGQDRPDVGGQTARNEE
jgi:hypothetical protein